MANRFLSNIKINDAYTFPASDGTSGQVITTDGSGNLSFSDVTFPDGARSNFVYYDVKNSSGSTINKGTAVMAAGTDGNSGHILISPMVADGSVEPKYFMGVLETTLLNGEIGKVVHFGEISQLNTTAFADGDILWCDPANPGGFTVTEPLGPNVKIAAAIVISSAVNGKIKVRVQGNAGLHELHDVRTTSQSDGQLLVWDNTLGVWKNNGTATIDYTNGRVGIGTDFPGKKLHVYSSGNEVAFFQGISGGAWIDIQSSTSNLWSIGATGPDSMGIYNRTSSSYAMTIMNGGNVGIGKITGIDYKLDVNGIAKANAFYATDFFNGTGYPYNTTFGSGANASTATLRAGSTSGYETSIVLRGGDVGNDITISTSSSPRLYISPSGDFGINTTSPKAKLDVNGTIVFNSKSMSISDTFATVLTINMTQHTGCYVKITAFGDWTNHSSSAYLGEFFIQHGSDGYMEPGIIIRQVDNTYIDSIEAKIVDPVGVGAAKDFTIQLRSTSGTDTPFTIHLQYEVRGLFNSVS